MAALTSDEVWELCHDIYMNHGVKLSLPANTDRTRTYQWRYVTLLASKFDGWGFGHEMAERFLEIVVVYAKKRKLSNKGLSVFCQSNVLDVCLKTLKTELEIGDGEVYGLVRSHEWLNGTGATVQDLVKCERYGAHTNLVKWYRAGKITDLFLSLSRTAGKAIRRLPEDEREHLPTSVRLYLMRDHFLMQPENRKRALAILKEDMKNGSPATCG